MKRKILSCLLIITIGLTLPSSAGIWSTDPGDFAKTARTKVRKGMSKSDVRNILGRPLAVTDDGSGEIWHYSKMHGGLVWVPLGLAGGEQSGVTVTFNARGRVTRVHASTVRTGPAADR
ncbi:MAG TPA: outer membrane protein assembly factor BamE [Verrucomicrobiae bacterium]|nr:outer membrane protein assembly factor BamE [Verrucomicrobiae bacterium]